MTEILETLSQNCVCAGPHSECFACRAKAEIERLRAAAIAHDWERGAFCLFCDGDAEGEKDAALIHHDRSCPLHRSPERDK